MFRRRASRRYGRRAYRRRRSYRRYSVRRRVKAAYRGGGRVGRRVRREFGRKFYPRARFNMSNVKKMPLANRARMNIYQTGHFDLGHANADVHLPWGTLSQHTDATVKDESKHWAITTCVNDLFFHVKGTSAGGVAQVVPEGAASLYGTLYNKYQVMGCSATLRVLPGLNTNGSLIVGGGFACIGIFSDTEDWLPPNLDLSNYQSFLASIQQRLIGVRYRFWPYVCPNNLQSPADSYRKGYLNGRPLTLFRNPRKAPHDDPISRSEYLSDSNFHGTMHTSAQTSTSVPTRLYCHWVFYNMFNSAIADTYISYQFTKKYTVRFWDLDHDAVRDTLQDRTIVESAPVPAA